MAKGDVGAVASLFEKILDFMKFRFETKELRDLRDAAEISQKMNRRAVKLYPELREDRIYMKHKKKFDDKLI